MSTSRQENGVNSPTVSSWPLVIVIEDCFIPESAGEIVKLTELQSIEESYAMILALAVYAELGLRRERLN